MPETGRMRLSSLDPTDPSICRTEGFIAAKGNSAISILGSNFTVNNVPVDYGVLENKSGILRGTLASGTSIETTFYHGAAAPGFTSCSGVGIFGGVITVPEPELNLSIGLGMLLLRWLGHTRRRRAKSL